MSLKSNGLTHDLVEYEHLTETFKFITVSACTGFRISQSTIPANASEQKL